MRRVFSHAEGCIISEIPKPRANGPAVIVFGCRASVGKMVSRGSICDVALGVRQQRQAQPLLPLAVHERMPLVKGGARRFIRHNSFGGFIMTSSLPYVLVFNHGGLSYSPAVVIFVREVGRSIDESNEGDGGNGNIGFIVHVEIVSARFKIEIQDNAAR